MSLTEGSSTIVQNLIDKIIDQQYPEITKQKQTNVFYHSIIL